MDISSYENAGTRCGMGSGKVKWNVRNWLNRNIGDCHKKSDLCALRKQNN